MNSKKWIVGLFIFCTVGLVYGQGVRVLEIRGGYFNPKDTNAGLILGGSYGISIDERVDIRVVEEDGEAATAGAERLQERAQTWATAGVDERAVIGHLVLRRPRPPPRRLRRAREEPGVP